MSGANTARAQAAWGPAIPDWVVVLAERCDEAGSQRVVAEAIGYGASTVNQVLGRSYPGDVDRVAEKVRGRFMHATVECPVLGEISTADCLDHQKRPLAGTNPQRVRLWRACRGCPNASTQRRS